MIKVKARLVADSVGSIQFFSSQKLSQQANLKLRRTWRKVDQAVRDYNECVKDLQEEFSDKDEKDNTVTLSVMQPNGALGTQIKMTDSDNVAQFNRKLEELRESEIEIDVEMIPAGWYSTIGDSEGVHWMALDWLISDSDEEAPKNASVKEKKKD